MSPNAGGWGGGGVVCGVSVNGYSCAHGAQINFVDLNLPMVPRKGCRMDTGRYFCACWLLRVWGGGGVRV